MAGKIEELMRQKDEIILCTHPGTFHMDDVMATSVLKLTAQRIGEETGRDIKLNVQRTLRIPEGDNVIVYDVGREYDPEHLKFDHHQDDSPVRDNGIPYAACGMIWQECGDYLAKGDEDWKNMMEMNVMQAIDAQDNGYVDPFTGKRVQNPLSVLYAGYNPSWNSRQTPDEAFAVSCDKCLELMTNMVKSHDDALLAHDKVREAADKAVHGVVVLDQFMPYGFLGKEEDPLLVIMPSNRGGYNVQTLTATNPEKMSLPESWLENAPGGCSFVHKGRFIAAFDSMEHALTAAHSAADDYIRTNGLSQQYGLGRETPNVPEAGNAEMGLEKA